MAASWQGLRRDVSPGTADGGRRRGHVDRRLLGLLAALALMALAMLVPALTGWDVHVKHFPPLHADWRPRVGPGTLPAVVIAGAALVYGRTLCAALTWRRLLFVCWLASLAWLLSLALVDGAAGIGHILNTHYEYLNTARSTTDVSATLHEYVSHIPYGPGHWPVHIAGHPPGALLFFVLLVRVGLGSGLAAGLVVTVIASTTPVAVLVALRTLGAGALAQRAAPFLVLSPAAIWAAVSADGMFAAAAAWGLAALAVAAVRRSIGWSLLAGLVLGYCVMMSYGLPLFGVLALTVLMAARCFYPLGWAVGAALAVVLGFAAAGFSWWEAYPALSDRYFAGVGGSRPAAYWMWGDLAALCFSAGPLVGAGLAQSLGAPRRWVQTVTTRPVVFLSAAAALSIALADVSQMSKGEVERIWLPFVPWLLVSCALLPTRWRRAGLAIQVVTALVVQHLLFTGW